MPELRQAPLGHRTLDATAFPSGLVKQQLLTEVAAVLVELRGSLALTGIGHGTNKVRSLSR